MCYQSSPLLPTSQTIYFTPSVQHRGNVLVYILTTHLIKVTRAIATESSSSYRSLSTNYYRLLGGPSFLPCLPIYSIPVTIMASTISSSPTFAPYQSSPPTSPFTDPRTPPGIPENTAKLW